VSQLEPQVFQSVVLPTLSLLVSGYVAFKVHVMHGIVKSNDEKLAKLEKAVQLFRKEFTDAESAKALWAGGVIGQLEKIEAKLQALGDVEVLHQRVSALIGDVRELTDGIRQALGQIQLAGNIAANAKEVAEKAQQAVTSISDMGKPTAQVRR
jgi:hypothetical protein